MNSPDLNNSLYNQISRGIFCPLPYGKKPWQLLLYTRQEETDRLIKVTGLRPVPTMMMIKEVTQPQL